MTVKGGKGQTVFANEKVRQMKVIVKCCLALVLGFAAVGYSKDVGHKKVQLWKDGPFWAETNIGAEKPWEGGYYFWWGDTIGYKRVNNSWVASDGSSSSFSFERKNTSTIGKSESDLRKGGWVTTDGVLDPRHDAAHVYWGGKWRMPTRQELKDICDKCDWTWTEMNGVNGYVVRGRGDYRTASIFLPCAGGAAWASLGDAGWEGYYWSSVPDSGNDTCYYLSFTSRRHDADSIGNRFYGCLVRPVQGEL